ncbi:MAG: hypothetical protein E6J90_11750 [Deltaproteobacteria bacterium]|nr:MAG: hypothetical protein E6J91_45250 [Deltaproteobacteria bacterium]TMQ22841.1 MAG: hypothetical protein E6J90_11750 [Deltaproteobacteria bacterium]
MRAVWLLAACAACGNDRAAPVGDDPGSDDDPLAVSDAPPPGSLDDLHPRILAKRCSGQPGLCHNGQFEPNLSTPALTYAYVVGRPSIEKLDRLRVRPGDAARSVLIDKLRNRNGVSTQMPLGADPLAEADIQALEAWIDGGALRAPGAAPPPVLDNPPHRPEVAIFDAGGARLDGAGPVKVNPGTTLVLRHSVQDFETADAAIPFAAVILGVVSSPNKIADGLNVVLEPTASDPQTGRTSYDAAGPMSRGDRLDYLRSWTIGTTLTVIDPRHKENRFDVSAHGLTLAVFAVYLDALPGGMAAFDTSASQIQIQ